MIETKTQAYIVRGRGRGVRRTPCFINGHLPRPRHIYKVLVYYFKSDGELEITLIPAQFVEEREFKLRPT